MALGSYLHMEIAEARVHQLKLRGTLKIEAKNPLIGQPVCLLENVQVENAGARQRTASECWQLPLQEKEQCLIEIQGNGQFYARGVTLKGSAHFVVPDGKRMQVSEREGVLEVQIHPLH